MVVSPQGHVSKESTLFLVLGVSFQGYCDRLQGHSSGSIRGILGRCFQLISKATAPVGGGDSESSEHPEVAQLAWAWRSRYIRGKIGRRGGSSLVPANPANPATAANNVGSGFRNDFMRDDCTLARMLATDVCLRAACTLSSLFAIGAQVVTKHAFSAIWGVLFLVPQPPYFPLRDSW